MADTIDDDLYKWSVKVSNFDVESPLHADLAELKQRCGYDYIELQLVT